MGRGWAREGLCLIFFYINVNVFYNFPKSELYNLISKHTLSVNANNMYLEFNKLYNNSGILDQTDLFLLKCLSVQNFRITFAISPKRKVLGILFIIYFYLRVCLSRIPESFYNSLTPTPFAFIYHCLLSNFQIEIF